jgi:uncharacterized protein YdaU (DUF1376 family)
LSETDNFGYFGNSLLNPTRQISLWRVLFCPPKKQLHTMSLSKSYYFQHDYNASNDAKILFLRQQLGMEGYGIYWFILEQLAQAGGILPLKIVPVLAMTGQTQESKVRAIIEGYELFCIEEDKFFSLRLNRHIDVRKELSEYGKNGAAKRWANRVAISNGNGDPNAKERKKGKEIKEINGVLFCFFSDGTHQQLGESQTHEYKNDQLSPKAIIQGHIY